MATPAQPSAPRHPAQPLPSSTPSPASVPTGPASDAPACSSTLHSAAGTEGITGTESTARATGAIGATGATGVEGKGTTGVEGKGTTGVEGSAGAKGSAPALGIADPLAALGSMWSGWMAPSTASQPPAAPSGPVAEDTTRMAEGGGVAPAQVAVVSATANEWLAGAGKLWESAVKDVGSKLKSAAEGVDAGAFGEQVEVMRQRSGKFVEDVSKSVREMNLAIDQGELAKRAEVITVNTKELLDKASATLQQGRQEALEIFVDGGAGDGAGAVSVAPWDAAALPEDERKFADALRQEMLKIVVDSIYSRKKRTDLFLSGAAEGTDFDFAEKAGMAMAALEADKNMRRLRAGLVPGKMKEDAFWKTYFYHVQRVRQTLVANGGVMPETEEEEDYDPEALFADDGEDEELAALSSPSAAKPIPEVEADEAKGNGAVASTEGKRNWEDEIDAIFDDDE